MKKLIIKIVKGIVFGFYTIGCINQIFIIVSEAGNYPYGATGQVIGTLLFLLLLWYLLYKCQYKWIKKLFRKPIINSHD